ncbi:MAG: class D sortase [Candidatus Omnitrophica bacterium]|nr:class D sortase [Candidatus Omnitrophota bacterium]
MKQIRKIFTSKLNWILFAIVIILFVLTIFFAFRFHNVKIPTGRVQKTEIKEVEEVEPVLKDFTLIIPRLNINAPVIKNVESTNKEIYFKALEKGVAHYKGTKLPGEGGNVFIYGHSSFYEDRPGDYKKIFEHLEDMQNGDKIIVWYEGQKYEYTVFETKIVEPNETSVLNNKEFETVTIMTCVPPGTTEKRFIVVGKRD